MDACQSRHAIGESIGLEQFGDVARNNVCFFFVSIIIAMGCLGYVVLFHQIAGLIDGKFSLDVPTGRLFEVFRGCQPINRLQADSHTPGFSPFALCWLPLANVFVEIKIPVFR